MASVQQVDWVAIKLEAAKAVERAEQAIAFTRLQLDAFDKNKMLKAAKKYHVRLLRQQQQLDEAKSVLAEVSAR